MKKTKKLISVLLALTLILSVGAIAFNAFGKSQELTLDVKQSAIIDGEDDLAWFYFTPKKSGVYSFLSYNIPASEAYLFLKEKENLSSLYTQLAYATNDPEYSKNDHNQRQFCLTYHLEEGIKYHFAAGWFSSETRTNGVMTVMLRCDKYDDENRIVSVEASTTATLQAYYGGNYYTDKNGEYYYHYNYSRIISNMNVTVNYEDGTSTTAYGAQNIDGYPVVYKDNQAVEHWYPQSNKEYTSNTLTVCVYDQSCEVEVIIEYSNTFPVTGIVTDILGRPVKGAVISQNNSTLAKTDDNGYYAFSMNSGTVKVNVSAPHSFTATVTFTVSATQYGNNFKEDPIILCTCNYYEDKIINAKDFAEIRKTLSGEELVKEEEQFKKVINKTEKDFSDQAIKAT